MLHNHRFILIIFSQFKSCFMTNEKNVVASATKQVETVKRLKAIEPAKKGHRQNSCS